MFPASVAMSPRTRKLPEKQSWRWASTPLTATPVTTNTGRTSRHSEGTAPCPPFNQRVLAPS